MSNMIYWLATLIFGLFLLVIASVNCWCAFRAAVRLDMSSPSPMPVVGTVMGLLVAAFIPGVSNLSRAYVAASAVFACEISVLVGALIHDARLRWKKDLEEREKV